MNNIFLINTKNLPCPGSHYLHTVKFLNSFIELGFNYFEINNISEIDKITKNDLIYISNHHFQNRHINEVLENKNLVKELEMLSGTNGIPILWFWHNYLDLALKLFDKKFLLTGEHFRLEPKLEKHKNVWKIQNSIENYVPLTFASIYKPPISNKIPFKIYNAQFVGFNYKNELNQKLIKKYKRVKIINTPPFITESKRIRIYKASKITLAWHHENNILNSVFTERFFEGLALGSLVISDQPECKNLTNGIAEYVNSEEQIYEIFDKYTNNKKLLDDKILLGYKWSKEFGTYSKVAEQFKIKIEQLY